MVISAFIVSCSPTVNVTKGNIKEINISGLISNGREKKKKQNNV